MKHPSRGFTLIELLITLALVGVAASVALPLASVIDTRAKEFELRRSLRIIRSALDAYKQASDSGLIEKATGASGYPPTLEALVNGAPQLTSAGLGARSLIFMRSVPTDPFFPDQGAAAHSMWNIRPYGAPQGAFINGKDVYDVKSRSGKVALDGSHYSNW